ncbi:hypothetical protein KIN20_035694 [Parelaphostrongylus tenuis]|uniref:Uncharacterized protein n=1 Tax=Parelaphostrongylus tenuis TaxID=148309 RepID=A0AAD5RC57_PARTN|nr:hypothetical protein KIN20_035694 [Parelaphostrongylus tenuis]
MFVEEEQQTVERMLMVLWADDVFAGKGNSVQIPEQVPQVVQSISSDTSLIAVIVSAMTVVRLIILIELPKRSVELLWSEAGHRKDSTRSITSSPPGTTGVKREHLDK